MGHYECGLCHQRYDKCDCGRGSPTGDDNECEKRCTAIADKVVPEYRDGKRSYSCGGHTAKRWQAAWDAASIALRGTV